MQLVLFWSKIATTIHLRLETVAGVPVAEVDDGDGGAGHEVAGHALAHQHRLLRQVLVQRWKAKQFTVKVLFRFKMMVFIFTKLQNSLCSLIYKVQL